MKYKYDSFIGINNSVAHWVIKVDRCRFLYLDNNPYSNYFYKKDLDKILYEGWTMNSDNWKDDMENNFEKVVLRTPLTEKLYGIKP